MRRFLLLFLLIVFLTGCAASQDEIQSLKIRVINLEATLNKQNQRYEDLEKKIDKLNKKLISFKNKLSTDLLVEVKTHVISDLEDLKNEQALLASQLEDLKFSQEAQQKEMFSQLEKLSTQIQVLDLKIKELEKKLALAPKTTSNETKPEEKEFISSNATTAISVGTFANATKTANATNATKIINATKTVKLTNATNMANTTKSIKLTNTTNATKSVSPSNTTNITNATNVNNATNGTTLITQKTEEKPLNEADLYEKAYSYYQKGDFKDARKFFKEYIKRFPKGKWIGQAYFWIGESYFKEKKYEEAILNYQKLIELPGWHPLKPTAMFRQAQAFKALGDIEAYKILLKKVINQYPNSKEAEIAKKLLK